MPPVTASQTIGPFWHLLADPAVADLTRFGARGARIALSGRVLDGDGAPVGDACIEIWQATPLAPHFTGWGRTATAADGGYRLVTLAPDAAAPCIAVAILARGLVKPLWTRVYFADNGDALLSALPPDRRATLLATSSSSGEWHWDIRMQGGGETVFLDL